MGRHLSDSQPAPPWRVQSCDLHGGGGLNLAPASPHLGLECTGQTQAHAAFLALSCYNTASSDTSEDGALLVLQSTGPCGAVRSPRNSGSIGEGEVRCPVTLSFLSVTFGCLPVYFKQRDESEELLRRGIERFHSRTLRYQPCPLLSAFHL